MASSSSYGTETTEGKVLTYETLLWDSVRAWTGRKPKGTRTTSKPFEPCRRSFRARPHGEPTRLVRRFARPSRRSQKCHTDDPCPCLLRPEMKTTARLGHTRIIYGHLLGAFGSLLFAGLADSCRKCDKLRLAIISGSVPSKVRGRCWLLCIAGARRRTGSGRNSGGSRKRVGMVGYSGTMTNRARPIKRGSLTALHVVSSCIVRS